MGLRIQNNVEAFNTHRQLTTTSTAASKSMEKLSSGYRINRAADDAAGLAISEKMRGQIGGLAQAQRNAQDGISLVQTAEGALTEVHSMLQRVRDLKVQYNNGTNSNDDKVAIAAEVAQIASEVSDIVSDTKFNGTAVFGPGQTFSFQVGANDGETISTSATTFASGVGSGGLSNLTGITGASGASAALNSGGALGGLSDIDNAIKNVSKVRADLGAIQNRLEHRLNNLATYQENLTASESRIRDVDMAAEMTKFTKLNILQQAGTSMLSQANQAPQGVLALLR
ncbi:flagellin N-terminal helical domain-containing protein [Solirubrobacter soli]|uniref:flagellin N-terminal helical domain-containing protein n=1 Tax=Solirubrobacter soli TaxID=363832 RepID=UPI0004006803|nr:flagellin [Solirubrobacter soli]